MYNDSQNVLLYTLLVQLNCLSLTQLSLLNEAYHDQKKKKIIIKYTVKYVFSLYRVLSTAPPPRVIKHGPEKTPRVVHPLELARHFKYKSYNVIPRCLYYPSARIKCLIGTHSTCSRPRRPTLARAFRSTVSISLTSKHGDRIIHNISAGMYTHHSPRTAPVGSRVTVGRSSRSIIIINIIIGSMLKRRNALRLEIHFVP